MRNRTKSTTPEQQANVLKSEERILDFLSRRGLLLLAVFLLVLGWTMGLLSLGESAHGRWHAGYATGTWFGLLVAATVVALCQLLVMGLRRSVNDSECPPAPVE